MRHFFADRFPELEEITFTFNRINLFFYKEIEITSLADQLISFSIADYKRKLVCEYWELPICFDPRYTEDLEQHFKGAIKDPFATIIKHFYPPLLSSNFMDFYQDLDTCQVYPKNYI